MSGGYLVKILQLFHRFKYFWRGNLCDLSVDFSTYLNILTQKKASTEFRKLSERKLVPSNEIFPQN